MRTIVNMTPHTVNFVDGDKNLSIEPCGIVPRCSTSEQQVSTINFGGRIEIPIVKSVFGDVKDLPEKKDDTILVVSRAVVAACPDRDDLVFPNGLVRDDDGNIIGCTSLAVL